jgi:hypothetical protein
LSGFALLQARPIPSLFNSNLAAFTMISKLTLKDPTLLREACLVAGEWVAADSGGTIAGR